MRKPGKQEVMQAVAFVLCWIAALRTTSGLGGSEFSGGWLTGPLLSMFDYGSLLLLPALLLAFVFPRIAAALGISAALLCLPIYFFFTAPIPFARIFAPGHEFKVQPDPGFHWSGWVVTGMLTCAITIYVCLRSFGAPRVV